MPLPTVALAHPTLIARPIHHDGWVYEEKVDGASPYVGGRTLKWLKVQQQDYREGERGRETKPYLAHVVLFGYDSRAMLSCAQETRRLPHDCHAR